jgi:hypothetical protein
MSRSVGCLVGIGAALLLLLSGCYALEVLLREAKGCSHPTAWEEVTGQRLADDLDSALAASAGVRTSRVEWLGTTCSASIRADAVFHRSATSDEVAGAARVIAEARRRPDAAGVSTTFTFDATGPDGALHLDENVPPGDMVAEARAWAALSRP